VSTKPEQQMRLDLVADFKELHMKPIENKVGVGTPDVCYIGGHAELKRILEWPARDGILKPHRYTNAQRIWLKTHWDLGGRAFLVIQIAQEWLVFAGPDAWPIGTVDCPTVRSLAILHMDRYRKEDLKYILTAPLDELEHIRSIKCTQTLASKHMKNFTFTAAGKATRSGNS
jgi:hypothetical protein